MQKFMLNLTRSALDEPAADEKTCINMYEEDPTRLLPGHCPDPTRLLPGHCPDPTRTRHGHDTDTARTLPRPNTAAAPTRHGYCPDPASHRRTA